MLPSNLTFVHFSAITFMVLYLHQFSALEQKIQFCIKFGANLAESYENVYAAPSNDAWTNLVRYISRKKHNFKCPNIFF